jgi:hypothetical protein
MYSLESIYNGTEAEFLAFLVYPFRCLQIILFLLSPIIFSVWARKCNVGKWGYRLLIFLILFVLVYSAFFFLERYWSGSNYIRFYVATILSLLLAVGRRNFLLLACIFIAPSVVVDVSYLKMDLSKRKIAPEECDFIASANSLLEVSSSEFIFNCRNSIKAHIDATNFIDADRKYSCPSFWWDSRDLDCLRNVVTEDEIRQELVRCHSLTLLESKDNKFCDQGKVDQRLRQLIVRCERHRPVWHGCGPLFD